MSIITKALKQVGIYWGPPVESGDGDHTFPDPVAIKCRWDDVDGVVSDPRSHDQLTKTQVMVDRDMKLDGYLSLGLLSGLDSDQDPRELDGAHRITGFLKMPNLRNTEYYRLAELG